MIEGSGSRAGSTPLTNGSGSGSRRPKNTWIRWIRIRNTAAWQVVTSWDTWWQAEEYSRGALCWDPARRRSWWTPWGSRPWGRGSPPLHPPSLGFAPPPGSYPGPGKSPFRIGIRVIIISIIWCRPGPEGRRSSVWTTYTGNQNRKEGKDFS